VVAAIEIQRTRDETDYKLTVKKGMCQPAPTEDAQVAGEPKAPTAGADNAARELILHFHKVFHGVANNHPQSKELTQATALVAQYGFDCAKHVIDFAHTAAAETKYRPQTFGGILQYAARAASTYDDIRRRKEAAAELEADIKARHDFEALHAELAKKRRAQAEARLRELSPEKFKNLRERVQTELLHSHWLDESSLSFQRVLEHRMIAEIIREMGELP
jgi:hypothetical protein